MPRPVQYALRDRDILRWIMNHPGTGVPYTTRTLGDAAGCSHSLVGRLLSGATTSTTADTAHALSEALGTAVLVLFAPPTSP